MKHTLGWALPMVVAVVLTGCGGSDDAARGDDANLTEVPASDPITLDNFFDHPRLRGSTSQLRELDELRLAEKLDDHDNPTCTPRLRKSTDDKGRIRKVAKISEEGGVSSTVDAVYDSDGKLRYLSSVRNGPGTTGSQDWVFLDASGEVLFRALHEWTRPFSGTWRIPTEPYQPNPMFKDPATWWSAGCAG